MALDFPASPSNGQTFSGPNGVVWSWDGTKWINAVAASVAYAPIDSPVFTGTPSMPAGAVGVTQTAGDNDNSLATTAFVTNAVGAVPGGATIAATPPALNPGALWWDSTGGQLYVRFNDGNSTQWTAATNIAGLANAATLTDVGSALNNVGRNLIHNSAFTIAQRGSGPFIAGGFTLDRWNLAITTDTVSVTRAVLSDADRAQIGDEAAFVCFSNAFTGNAAAGAFHFVSQAVEGARRLSGKTVTLSFWAKASSTLKLGINGLQSFGTGGSPSAAAWMLTTGLSVTLTTSFARYSVSFTVPSTAGKTFGTNLDDFTTFALWFSSGASNAALGGNPGVQSGTINIWGVQMEIAQPGQTQPTPLEKRDPVLELQQCQRFYQTGQMLFSGNCAPSSVQTTVTFQPMRATPTITPTTYANTNLSVPTWANLGNNAAYVSASVTATGSWQMNLGYALSADL